MFFLFSLSQWPSFLEPLAIFITVFLRPVAIIFSSVGLRGGGWAAPLHTLEPACPPLLPLLPASQSLLAGTSPSPLRTCATAPPEQACPGTLSTREILERGSGAVAPPEQACPGTKSTGETLERGSCGARAHVRPRPLYRLALERCPLGSPWKGARVRPRPLNWLALERRRQGSPRKEALLVPAPVRRHSGFLRSRR